MTEFGMIEVTYKSFFKMPNCAGKLAWVHKLNFAKTFDLQYCMLHIMCIYVCTIVFVHTYIHIKAVQYLG